MKQSRPNIIIRCLLFVIPVLLFMASYAYSASEHYYYLQIGSFRVKENAIRFAQKLIIPEVDTVIRGEDVPGFGYMHRVYVGPFSSWKEADSRGRELRKNSNVITSAVVHKTGSPILSNLGKQPDAKAKASTDLSGKISKQIGASEEKPLEQKMVEVAPVKPEPSPAPIMQPELKLKSEKEQVQDQRTDRVVTAEPPKDLISKPDIEPTMTTRKGQGRNIAGGNVVVGLQHTYFEVSTELKNRKSITSDGTTASTTDVSIEGIDKKDYPTLMHLDTLRGRFGLTDYLELFVDIGSAYRELSNLKFAYGGGARLKLFEQIEGEFPGFYIACQGEYFAGELESEYTSSSQYRWKKETDWNEFIARLEFGVSRAPFTVYAGGTYLHYREDTDRRLLDNLPPLTTSFMFQDKLEEDNSFGAFGGVVLQLTPHILANFEGQIGNPKAIFGALQYQFK